MATNRVPLAIAKGIDKRDGAESPWERLENWYPRNGSLRRFQGWGSTYSKDAVWTGSTALPAFPGKWTVAPITCTKREPMWFGKVDDKLVSVWLNGSTTIVGVEVPRSGIWIETTNIGNGDVERRLFDFDTYPQLARLAEADCCVVQSGRRIFITGNHDTFCLFWGDDIPSTKKGAVQAPDGSNSSTLAQIKFDQGAGVNAYAYLTGSFGGKIVEVWQNRLFFAGLDGTDNVLSVSLTEEQMKEQGTDVPTSEDTAAYGEDMLVWTDPLDFFSIAVNNWKPTGQGPIRALKSFQDKMLVFTDRAVLVAYNMTVDDSTGSIPSLTVDTVATGIGCDGKWACCTTPYGVVFTYNNRVFITDGTQVSEIGTPVAHLLTGGSSARMSTSSKTRCVYSAKRDTVFIGCDTAPINLDNGFPPSQQSANVLCYDFGETSWYTITAPIEVGTSDSGSTDFWTSPNIYDIDGDLYCHGAVLATWSYLWKARWDYQGYTTYDVAYSDAQWDIEYRPGGVAYSRELTIEYPQEKRLTGIHIFGNGGSSSGTTSAIGIAITDQSSNELTNNNGSAGSVNDRFCEVGPNKKWSAATAGSTPTWGDLVWSDAKSFSHVFEFGNVDQWVRVLLVTSSSYNYWPDAVDTKSLSNAEIRGVSLLMSKGGPS